ncbi:hypothetical protein ZHAS_00011160 [Anopheles sinensis]|uniref:Uncharacterized protein n=1 Tax=Anopheles sinensis TaxID=74873 RepID=A0A084VZH0_ANOSI|nr:hypothetical protein ZHAS_00011160 [Anopheles sinensis]
MKNRIQTKPNELTRRPIALDSTSSHWSNRFPWQGCCTERRMNLAFASASDFAVDTNTTGTAGQGRPPSDGSSLHIAS